MFQNLGIALGSGVDEWHRQQDESRKQTAESRADTQFKQQQEQYTRQQKIRDTRDKLIKEYQDFDGYLKGMDGVADDKLADYVRQGVTRYNTNPYYKNGLFGQVVEHKGAPHIAHGSFQDQNLEYIPVTREHAKQAGAAMQQMLREQLAMVDSDKMEGFLDHREKMGLEGRKVGAEEDKVLAVKGHYKDIADHYRWVEGQPQLRELGNGQVGMFKGEKYLGAYGPARPILGHGSGAGALTKDPMKGLLGFDEKTGTVFQMNQDGTITSKVLKDEAGNPVPMAIVKGLFHGGHNQVPKPVPQVNPKILESALTQWEGRPQKPSDQGAWDARFDSMYPGMRGYIMSGGSEFTPGSGGLTLDLRGGNSGAAPDAYEVPSVNMNMAVPSQTSREARGLRLPSASAPLSTANFSPVTQRKNAIAEQQLRAKYGPNWEAVLGVK